jgi:uncharacterized membrane protein
MTPRAGAFALLALTLACGVTTLLLLVLSGSATRPGFGFPGSTLVFAVSCSVVGAAITLRRPHNAVAWILLASGLSAAVYELTVSYAYYAIGVRGGDVPAGVWAAWVGSWMWIPTSSLVPVLVPLVFPDGQLPSRRWRPLVWYAAFTLVIFILATALVPGPMEEGGFVRNPVSPFRDGDFSFRDVQLPTLVLLLVALIGSVAALVRRFHGSRGVLRLQLKWFVYASALAAVWMFLIPFLQDSKPYQVGGILMITAIPIVIGIAIMRYRLYDIDLLINRTLVYGVTSAAIALTFFAGIVALQAVLRPFTSGSELATAASTLVSFALFQPIRRRVQSAVDRRFDRSRYDAERTLDAFAIRLRDEVDLDAVRADLVSVTYKTMRPAHASVWLRERARVR